MVNVKIREGKVGDIKRTWPVEIETRLHHKKITPEKYSQLDKSRIDKKAKLDFIKEFKKDLRKKRFLFLVAEKNEEIVGYLSAYVFKWKWSDKPPKVARLGDVVVLKKYRREGIATELIKEFEKWAKKEKAKFLSLNVWIKNKSAFKLYKKNKFERFNIEMVKGVR